VFRRTYIDVKENYGPISQKKKKLLEKSVILAKMGIKKDGGPYGGNSLSGDNIAAVA